MLNRPRRERATGQMPNRPALRVLCRIGDRRIIRVICINTRFKGLYDHMMQRSAAISQGARE